GLLLHVMTGSHSATSATTPPVLASTASPGHTLSGAWTALGDLTLTGAASITGQTGFVAIAPSDPRVVYEAQQSPASLRRTRNNGTSWQKLALPVDPTAVSAIEIYLSPLDANNVFLTLTAFKPVADTSPCSSALASVRLHGGILASGQVSCSMTYHSADG